jgi:hypothetical protein
MQLMKATVQILISIALLSISLFAQEKSGTCPVISIRGPMELIKPGEIANYSVEAKEDKDLNGLQYKWSVSEGTIVSGQGTTAIEVRQPNSNITVTVEINGLPHGCERIFSDTGIWDAGPAITLLDHFTIPLGTIAADRIENIRHYAYSNPNAGIFLVGHADNQAALKDLPVQTEKLIKQIMGQTTDGIYITNLDCQGPDNFIDVWLAPPGATPPTCQRSEEWEKAKQQACPSITVTGPADITEPHGVATFTASIDGPVPPNLMTRWSVEGADIVHQSRFSVDVTAENFCVPVTATIIIDGLPNGCLAKASESYEVTCDPGPQKLGELTGPKYTFDKKILERIKSVLLEQPNSQIYVFLPTGLTMPKAISRQFAKSKIDPSRLTISNSGDIKKIEFFLVPPGASVPAPGE